MKLPGPCVLFLMTLEIVTTGFQVYTIARSLASENFEHEVNILLSETCGFMKLELNTSFPVDASNSSNVTNATNTTIEANISSSNTNYANVTKNPGNSSFANDNSSDALSLLFVSTAEGPVGVQLDSLNPITIGGVIAFLKLNLLIVTIPVIVVFFAEYLIFHFDHYGLKVAKVLVMIVAIPLLLILEVSYTALEMSLRWFGCLSGDTVRIFPFGETYSELSLSRFLDFHVSVMLVFLLGKYDDPNALNSLGSRSSDSSPSHVDSKRISVEVALTRMDMKNQKHTGLGVVHLHLNLIWFQSSDLVRDLAFLVLFRCDISELTLGLTINDIITTFLLTTNSCVECHKALFGYDQIALSNLKPYFKLVVALISIFVMLYTAFMYVVVLSILVVAGLSCLATTLCCCTAPFDSVDDRSVASDYFTDIS